MNIGKSYFVWYSDKIGTPKVVAEKAKQQGCTSIMLKLADGSAIHGYPNESEMQRIERLTAVISECKNLGIETIGWQYVYGNDAPAEAAMAVKVSRLFDITGFIVDAEGEYKRAGMAVKATSYMTSIRDLMRIPIGLTSYRYPKYHRELPWKEFLSKCDFVVPQVYWVKSTNPAQQLEESVREYLALYTEFGIKKLPIYPVGSAYYDNTNKWQPTPSQIVEFYNAVKSMGLPGFSFWELNAAMRIGLDSTIQPLGWNMSCEEIKLQVNSLAKRLDVLSSGIDGIRQSQEAAQGQINILDALAKRIDEWINKY